MSATPPPLTDSYEGLFNRARVAQRAGDMVVAVDLYQRLVQRLGRSRERILPRRPNLRELYLQACVQFIDLLIQEGRYAEAIEVVETLLDTHPEQADRWHRDLAILRVARGEVETGLSQLRELAEQVPADSGRWIALAREARIEGRFVVGEHALEQAVLASAEADREEQAAVQHERFLLLREMGRINDALAAWEDAVALDPKVGNTVREVYTMLTDAGRYTEALSYVARDDHALQTGFQRGLVAQLTGRAIDARDEWRAVAALNPEDFDHGHDCWTEAVLRLGDPAPALERLPRLLDRHRTPRLLSLGGIAWAMHGDRQLAAELFQEAINLVRWQRPPRKRLEGTDWRLLDSLVSDDKIKKPLKSYFAVVETLWG